MNPFLPMITRIRKSVLYSRLRQYLPMEEARFTDDRALLVNAPPVTIDWPAQLQKPRVGIVQDYGGFPGWTKHARFLENNAFPFGIFRIHDHDWLEKAKDFDVIVGFTSSASYHLDEIREKYHLLETRLGKICYPSVENIFLFENKILEASLAKIHGIPYINTYVSHDKDDALRLIEKLNYPIVSKIVPSSASVGVELLHNRAQARKIVEQAFSNNGRKTHVVYARQKNFVYFQDFIPSDGYDIRVITVGNLVFGYYRKAPQGDFRASGMHHEEKRSLPHEAMRIARQVNRVIRSPQLVVDMIHASDGNYYINEISPICQMSTQDQLQVDGVPGMVVFDSEDTCHFEAGNYWVHELALREFFLNFYLPKFWNEA